MSYDFNADEVFEMAQQMERNGAKFYRDAAETAADSSNEELLLTLSKMEEAHEKMFESMRADLTAAEKTSTVFDPSGEASLYLRALVDSRVFFKKEIDVTSMEEILKSAIEAEKEIERALSLGGKAPVDTALRKLQSTMRNNVNTNYGNRAGMVSDLEKFSDVSLMDKLAGQAD